MPKQNIKAMNLLCAVCGVWTRLWKWKQIPFDILQYFARTIIILVIRSGGLVYAYTSLHCGAVDIIWLRLRPIAHVLNIVLYIIFVNTVGLPLVCCSASLACLFSFVLLLLFLLLLLLLYSHRSPARAKWNEKVRLSLNYLPLYLYIERIQCKIILCLSMYNITYYFLSSTPFRSVIKAKSYPIHIFEYSKSEPKPMCVCELIEKIIINRTKTGKTAKRQNGCMGANVFRCEHFQIFSFVGVEPVVSCLASQYCVDSGTQNTCTNLAFGQWLCVAIIELLVKDFFFFQFKLSRNCIKTLIFW